MAYTLNGLRTYVRDLTGIYSTDIITDDLVNRWINEAYFELGRLQKWSWAGLVTTLTGLTSPAFPDEFHPVLAYRVAIKVLDFEADDTKRGEFYQKEYEALVAAMYKYDLQANAYAVTNTMAGLISNVRTWLGEYSGSISDDVIEEKIMDAYDELYESAAWPFSKTPFPGMGWDYTRGLVFAAAARLAVLAGKDEAFVKAVTDEYGLALEELKVHFLITNTSIDHVTRANLRQLVRSVTGIYNRTVPDSLINAWINEEYQILASERNWLWLEGTAQIEVAAGTQTFSLPNGSFKVLEMYLVEKVASSDTVNMSVAASEAIYHVPSVLDVERNSEKYKYDVTANGAITISPAPVNDITIRVRYTLATPTLSSDNSTPAMAEKYRPLLAYRAAMRVCAYSNAPQNIMELCSSSAGALYEAMYVEYQLTNSTEPLQLGGSGLQSRKYLPWFRTA
jgi:hypothetical protein